MFGHASLTTEEVANTMSHMALSNRICGVLAALSPGIRVLARSWEHCLLRLSHHPLMPPPLTRLCACPVHVHRHTDIWNVYAVHMHVWQPPVIYLGVPVDSLSHWSYVALSRDLPAFSWLLHIVCHVQFVLFLSPSSRSLSTVPFLFPVLLAVSMIKTAAALKLDTVTVVSCWAFYSPFGYLSNQMTRAAM